MSVVQSNFIQPYPQEALGGALGLTCDDLAQVLEISKEHVIRRFKHLDISADNDEGFNFIQHWIKFERRGRPRSQWSFCVDTCKLIIASYNNKVGRGYFKYLLQCEKFVEEAAPKLVKKLKAAEEEIAALKKPIRRRVRTKSKIVEVVKRIEKRTDMFGKVEAYPIVERKPCEELTPEEQRQYKISHIALVSKGLSDKLDNLINEPLRKAKRKGLVAIESN